MLPMRFLTLVLTTGVLLGFTAGPATAVEPMAPGTWGPAIWTGYVAQWRGADPYTGYYSIHAEWRVPKAACPARPGSPDYRTSIWVGLSGFNGAYPFAQTGIGIRCTEGQQQPTYNAWREYISGVHGQNKPPNELELGWSTTQFPVVAGDTITADVVYENGVSLVRLHNPGRWPSPAEERLAVPRVVVERIGPFLRYIPITTNGVTAEVIVEPFMPAPLFDHVVFRNITASRSVHLPGFGYVPPRWLPFHFYSPTPYGSWNAVTGQFCYPTVFNDIGEFAVFQSYNHYNPFPPASYPGDITACPPGG